MQYKNCIRGANCVNGNQLQPIENFYKHKMMADGHLNKCKDCTRTDVKNRFDNLKESPDFIEKERERGRKKYHNLYSNGRGKKLSFDKKKDIMLRYSNKYPEKKKAAAASSHLRAPKGFQTHHWSYNDEHFKDVIILSIANHATLHRFLKYDQQYKMYRTSKGELLDTKDKHVAYAETILNNEISKKAA